MWIARDPTLKEKISISFTKQGEKGCLNHTSLPLAMKTLK